MKPTCGSGYPHLEVRVSCESELPLQYIFKFRRDRRPIESGGGQSGGPLIAPPKFDVPQQHYNGFGKLRGIIGEDDIFSVPHIEAFGSDRRRHNCPAHRHGLINLQARPTAHPQRDYDDRGLTEMIDHRWNDAGHFYGPGC